MKHPLKTTINQLIDLSIATEGYTPGSDRYNEIVHTMADIAEALEEAGVLTQLVDLAQQVKAMQRTEASRVPISSTPTPRGKVLSFSANHIR